LPYIDDTRTSKQKEYEPQYTWAEYIGENVSPIPFAETTQVIYKEMRQKGMDETTAKMAASAFISFIIAGGTGARVTGARVTELKDQKTDADKAFAKAKQDADEKLHPEHKTERLRKTNVEYLQSKLPAGTVPKNTTYDETLKLKHKLKFDDQLELWQINKDAGNDYTEPVEYKPKKSTKIVFITPTSTTKKKKVVFKADGGIIGDVMENRKAKRVQAILKA
jgi:hypothetical protein